MRLINQSGALHAMDANVTLAMRFQPDIEIWGCVIAPPDHIEYATFIADDGQAPGICLQQNFQAFRCHISCEEGRRLWHSREIGLKFRDLPDIRFLRMFELLAKLVDNDLFGPTIAFDSRSFWSE